MVQAVINISPDVNQVLNIVKAKYNLKDKSQAIEQVVLAFGKTFLEPGLRPDFIEKMLAREKESSVQVGDFKKHFGL